VKKRIPALVGAAVLSLGTLTACGGGGDDFCDQAKDAESQFEDLDPTESEQLDAFNELVDSAPDEIKSEMENLAGAFEDVDNLQNMDPAQLEDLEQDSNKITEYLETECDINTGE